MYAPHRRLRAWQTAHEVVLVVLELSATSWRPALGAAFGQLQRASLSVQLNIAEGYALGPGKRCRSALEIAYGSAVETAELLEVLSEAGAVSSDRTTAVLEINQECQKTLMGLIRRYRRLQPD